MVDEWISCQRQLPPDGVFVMTKIDNAEGFRNEQVLSFWKNRWWTGEGRNAIYVYYCPTHWKPWEPNPSIGNDDLDCYSC